MNSSLILSLILLTVVGFSFYFLLEAEGGVGELPRLLDRVGITLPQTITWPALPTKPPPANEYQSGNSRFSQGFCNQSSDCYVAGCSGEVCGTDPSAITTCEFSDSFPNQQGLSCACLSTGVCGWK